MQLLLHNKAARCVVAGYCPPSGWKWKAPTFPSCALYGGVKYEGPLQYITLGCRLDTAALYCAVVGLGSTWTCMLRRQF